MSGEALRKAEAVFGGALKMLQQVLLSLSMSVIDNML